MDMSVWKDVNATTGTLITIKAHNLDVFSNDAIRRKRAEPRQLFNSQTSNW
jgi:hypothetical protein